MSPQIPPSSKNNSVNPKKQKDYDSTKMQLLVQAQAKYSSVADNYYTTTQVVRVLLLVAAAVCLLNYPRTQAYLEKLWAHLRESPVFCSAYFETFYVTAVYALLIAMYPFSMHYIPFLQRFKVSSDITYVHQSLAGIIKDSIVYTLPLLAADAVIMKRYWGVPESEWTIRRHQWIQITRALPLESPSCVAVCVGVIASIVVFDALFFVLHYLLHQNRFLFRYVHAVHHEHNVMHAHVTNQLSIIERLLLIASANYALKLFRCHPITRLAFVPVFLWLLIENHTGYDLPWSLHRLVPRGLMGGPAKHHAHHLNGGSNYQPFLNYLDEWLNKRRNG